MGSWPDNVGIVALEIAFPSQYVDQAELERFNQVSAGKYVQGLGQDKMGFCTDREDICSMCLTVVHHLLERHHIQCADIGHLQVGTETILDKSKSVKTVLMQLFEPHGVTDVEGIDTTNACYGGTAALFNAIAWVESSAWDGRYALVVAADIAVYAKGPARPTGGAGAVAILVGPHAPLVFDRGVRASYMKHAYDFYKPILDSEYPVVDGMLSIKCYLSALDHCYQGYLKKAAKVTGAPIADVDSSFDYFAFHSPYCKLVQKSYARLVFNDFLNAPHAPKFHGLERFQKVQVDDSYFDKDIEKTFLQVSKSGFERRAVPSLLLANQVGNTYTSSVYGGLISLLINVKVEDLAGAKIGLFSYGSGLASSMFSLTVSEDCTENSKLRKLVGKLGGVKERLGQRVKVSPEKFSEILEIKERTYGKPCYEPVGGIDCLFPGTYYLTKVDEMHRRSYGRLTKAQNGTS